MLRLIVPQTLMFWVFLSRVPMYNSRLTRIAAIIFAIGFAATLIGAGLEWAGVLEMVGIEMKGE